MAESIQWNGREQFVFLHGMAESNTFFFKEGTKIALDECFVDKIKDIILPNVCCVTEKCLDF